MARSVCRDVSENRVSPSIDFQFSSRIFLLSLAKFYTSRLLNRNIQRRTHLTRARIKSSFSNSPQKLHFQPLITRDEGVEIEPEFRPIFWQIPLSIFNCMDNQTHRIHTAKSLSLLEDHLFHFYCPSVRVLIVFL